MEQNDFISEYLKYTEDSEVPTVFRRWSALAGIGAFLGRSFFYRHGHFTVYPNMYVMLIGKSGTRKSTAVKVMKKVLKLAGYTTIAANKTSKEKFMVDLAEGIAASGSADIDALMEQALWGSVENKDIAECFIMADEFNNFIGTNNLEFISLLTELWDYEGTFENKIKTGKSVKINDPTISILGGNTTTGFSAAFPTEILGQGFFSRLLLIYGEPNGKSITFPNSPEAHEDKDIMERLVAIRTSSAGNAQLTAGAKHLVDKIYKKPAHIEDLRFESYFSRRFNHLLKLCLIVAASSGRDVITEVDVVYANTLLTHAENLMPKALGEFGKSKHSDVSHKIMQLLDATSAPLTFQEIWSEVAKDLEKMGDLSTLLSNLNAAGKLQATKLGFLPKKRIVEFKSSDILDYSLLTEEEKLIGI